MHKFQVANGGHIWEIRIAVGINLPWIDAYSSVPLTDHFYRLVLFEEVNLFFFLLKFNLFQYSKYLSLRFWFRKWLQNKKLHIWSILLDVKYKSFNQLFTKECKHYMLYTCNNEFLKKISRIVESNQKQRDMGFLPKRECIY